MIIERKEENALMMHRLVPRILLSVLVFPIPEGREVAESGLTAGSTQNESSTGWK